MKTKTVKPSDAAIACRKDILDVIMKYGNRLSSMEVLAVLSYTVGQTIALQDQHKVSKEMIWKLVGDNIEAGNARVIAELETKSEGNA